MSIPEGFMLWLLVGIVPALVCCHLSPRIRDRRIGAVAFVIGIALVIAVDLRVSRTSLSYLTSFYVARSMGIVLAVIVAIERWHERRVSRPNDLSRKIVA